MRLRKCRATPAGVAPSFTADAVVAGRLFGSVMFGVQLACRFSMVVGMQVMPMSGVSVLSGGRDVLALLVLESLPVVMGGLLVMHGCLFVVVCDLIGVRHNILSHFDRGRSVRARTVWIARYQAAARGMTFA
jgi:hypothetical protein